MKIAVISDIHGNLAALESVFSHMDQMGVEELFCLGDILGYGPDPEACLAAVFSRAHRIIMGNHEAAVIDHFNALRFNSVAKQVIEWTTTQISDLWLERIKKLEFINQDENFTLFHGTLDQPHNFSYTKDQKIALDSLQRCDSSVLLFGHTHLPWALIKDGEKIKFEGQWSEFELKNRQRVILNPGSVGQPRDGDPRAAYATIDLKKGRFQLHRVEYDIEKTIEKLKLVGLPMVLGDFLRKGKGS